MIPFQDLRAQYGLKEYEIWCHSKFKLGIRAPLFWDLTTWLNKERPTCKNWSLMGNKEAKKGKQNPIRHCKSHWIGRSGLNPVEPLWCSHSETSHRRSIRQVIPVPLTFPCNICCCWEVPIVLIRRLSPFVLKPGKQSFNSLDEPATVCVHWLRLDSEISRLCIQRPLTCLQKEDTDHLLFSRKRRITSVPHSLSTESTLRCLRGLAR